MCVTMSVYVWCWPDNFGPAPDDLHVHIAGPVWMWDEVDLWELSLRGEGEKKII